MVHILKSKRKCRILWRTVSKNFPAINSFRFGLIFSVVLIATINVIEVDATECGTVNLYREATLGGKEVIKDEWPFIAALYYSMTSKYFCGGTIISLKHVLTAAHCIQTKGTGFPLPPYEVAVRLGAYNLTDRSETDAVDRSVTQIHVHPDWKFNEEKYDADIAVLVLNENVTFSDHIRSVCMPPADFLIDGLIGSVVGWGKTENGTAEGIPRKIEMNALSDAYCYETDKGIARFASERSFCGEGSGTPNNGDSGGVFFAVFGSVWVQFGTVSFIRPKPTGNARKVALYMKLTSLTQWITKQVEQSGGTISVATTKADLNCTYRYTNDSDAIYGCWLFDLNIRQEDFVVDEFTGSHDFDKDNDDVEAITFGTGVMASLPRNVGSIFKNLKLLAVAVDTSRILRSTLQKLERLEDIRFRNGNIRELSENSLWDLPNLQSFTLTKNQLKLLHPATFSRNSKLEIVRVSLNALKSLPWNLFRNNFQLWFVSFSDNSIETIDDGIFETNPRLKMVFFKGNRLRHLSKNLFQTNSELEVLDLSNNRFKTIDEQIFRANSKLRVLTLALNELEFLPAQLLRGKIFLDDLFLQKNALNGIDEQFFETNVGIKRILLHDNQLTHLPPNLFHNNSQLKLFQFASISLDSINENFLEKTTSLQNISFQFNILVELPRNLFRYNSMLENVMVSWNSLETIDEHIFESNSRLREVDFRHNFVTILPWKLFFNNSLLDTVHFEGNYLEAIDERTFQTNANLREVYLSSNKLQYLPENLFHNNSLLQIVDLSSNFFISFFEKVFRVKDSLEKMQSLPRNLFQANSRLQHINLRDSSLKVIEINFTVFKHVNYINLSGNDCIDAAFYDYEGGTYMFTNETRSPKSLTEFQDIVMANCHKILDPSEVRT